MKLSFIVPAHNEQNYLAKTLAGIFSAAQSLSHPFEVIVVDDASTDATSEIAYSAGARVINANYRNIAAVRNEGGKQGKGDVLFFVDADTLINVEVISEALEQIGKGAIGGGANIRYEGKLPLYIRLFLPYVNRRFERKKVLQGGFLFCTRSGFESVGGFDERYYAAEEVHFCKSLRKLGKVVRLPHIVITSGRKFRKHPWWRVVHMFYHMRQTNAQGQIWVQDKKNLDFWYGTKAK
jgi:glycosyltransferase involved in cell wall biosynthesis